jgi:ATP-binding cassette subfamily F protein 3
VIQVSHDRFLLEACVDRLWLVANGEVNPFDGDLDDYRRLVLGSGAGTASARNGAAEARASRTDLRRAAAEKRGELAPLKRRIDELDKTIAALTKRIAEIDATLADPKLYDRDPAQVATLGKERAEVTRTLSAAEDQWLALSEAYENALAAG